MIVLDREANSVFPLVEQIVQAIRCQIDDRRLPSGARLPSIRTFAAQQGVSRFTVVDAYDRLVALGYLEARHGSGFFVATGRDFRDKAAQAERRQRNAALASLIRRTLEADDGALKFGGPWLPSAWMNEMGLRQSIGTLARKNGTHLIDYGNPYGYLPLREHLALLLAERGIRADAAQIILTQGTSQALDLIIRRFVRPGDAVLVDDPGYYNLFANLRMQGARLLGVPRSPDGPDIAVLERLAAEHRPRIYFTQSALQNPTGSSILPHIGFRLLQLAQQFDFLVVEDDIFSDLQTTPTPRLAALDQLERVIYARSFSKTLSGSLRVGFLAARTAIADELAEVKMFSSITSSQFAERTLYLLLVDGQYRKFLAQLQRRMDETRGKALQVLERQGVEVFGPPNSGMFLWARFPGVEDAEQLVRSAEEHGILLAPGVAFRPLLEPSPWMRVNVTACDDPRVARWIRHVMTQPKESWVVTA
jgi:DNA-binding transcriptional MocR family regulator